VLETHADDDELLREALGAKKLKELRRQRNRLGDVGTLRFSVAQTPPDVRDALEGFLKLEASGWKGRNGSALISNDGDAAFIRRGCVALAATGQCEIATPATCRWRPALCCVSATAPSSSRSPSTKHSANCRRACSSRSI
jgi:hypothetical protein